METEEDRLRLDQQSRDRMAAHMKAVEEAEAAGSGDRGAWKWKIRQRIWDYMEENDIAANPRPVHHRIPNFVNAELTAKQVAALPEFQSAKWVKVNPDRPQSEVRATVLRSGKMLLVPQPRLRTGFFSVLDPAKIPMDKYGYACTQAGVVAFGEPIDLDAKLKAVSRQKKGTSEKASSGDKTLDKAGQEQLLCHDVPVDIICTPTRTIRVPPSLPKPTGIYWDKLSPQKLGSILILQKLKAKLEQETGQRLPSGPDEILPPTARRDGKGKGGKGGKGKKGKDEGRGERKGEKGKERKGDGRKGKASREQDALRMVKDTRTGYGSKGRVGKDFQGCNC
ncbi:unnamed protein product [Durusdinium trenchii]|uniref:Uncharacterized protein n=1 Tax=Durusdinium trenchii TaxID=1381693 RepID=A0ABP0SH07_9DINO